MKLTPYLLEYIDVETGMTLWAMTEYGWDAVKAIFDSIVPVWNRTLKAIPL